MRSFYLAIAVVAIILPMTTYGEDPRYVGRTVSNVIDELRDQGLHIAYSTHLVQPEYLVIAEPVATDAMSLIAEIVEPYGLAVQQEGALYLIVAADPKTSASATILVIVRDQRTRIGPEGVRIITLPATPRLAELSPGVFELAGLAPGAHRIDISADGYTGKRRTIRARRDETVVMDVTLLPESDYIESVTVSSSRYDLRNDLTFGSFFADQRFLETLPDLADDPVRAAQRLPGSASSGMSGRAHFRGGELLETGVLLNGIELFDPFHLRDFQNVFSIIDSRIVEGVEVFTGGYPVQHGNLMSGLVMIDTKEAFDSRHGEIGISVFNTSVLTGSSFAEGRGQWMVSARRGNLDLIIPPEDGSPAYHDVFAQASYEITPNAELSANLLFADDDVSIILANEVDDAERAQSDTTNTQFWLRLKNYWTDDLTSSTVLSRTTFSNERSGLIDDPERLVGAVEDNRDILQYDLRQDWTWSQSESQLMQWGFNVSVAESKYNYQSTVEFFGLSDSISGVVARPDYDIVVEPKGINVGVYLSDRFRLADKTFLELGARWDNQQYDSAQNSRLEDTQFSPRASLFRMTAGGTELRLSWGRYQQPQNINQLQIEDGVTEFFPAQRSDHLILGAKMPLSETNSLRLEVFRKEMRRLRPRYENLLDPLNLLPEIEPDRVRIAPDTAAATGFEIMFEGKSKSDFGWWASYSWSKVTDRIDNQDQFRTWDQRHAFHGGLNWSSEHWDIGIATYIRSGWRTADLRLDSSPAPPGYEISVGPRNAVELPVYATIDARISRRFSIGETTLTAFFEVTNLTNRDNVCCVDYDLEFDENDMAYLDRQTDTWFPLLPAFGVLWQF